MPQRLKSEDSDVKGNQYIVCGADYNKHDEEIRAIQFSLGVRSAAFPASGFSGCGGCDPIDGSSGPSGASMFECFACSGPSCYPTKPDCGGVVTDVATALANIFAQLQAIRDYGADTASGVVCITDDSVPSPDGKIHFPSTWTITTLVDDIPDNSQNDDDDATTAPSLADIATLNVINPGSSLDTIGPTAFNPNVGGYITIINDVSPFLLAQRARNLNLLGLTSLGGDNTVLPYYGINNKFLPPISTFDATQLRLPADRVFGLGTNVEIMAYESATIVGSTVQLHGVQRKQHGTTSTAHRANDLVFFGRVSIAVSPTLYKLTKAAGGNGRIDEVSCFLRSNGQVNLLVRNRDTGAPDYTDLSQYAYAEWQATLLRDLDPIPAFSPAQGGECV